MSFMHNNLEHFIIRNNEEPILLRMDAMTWYMKVTNWCIGGFLISNIMENSEEQIFSHYLILCKVNNIMQYVKVSIEVGEELLRKNQ